MRLEQMIFLFRALRRALRRHTSSEFGHFDEVRDKVFDEVFDKVRDKVGKLGRWRVSQPLLFRS